ncbi:hypothetical protein [Acidisoma sp. L85]|uniref:hypothetical protein n=1 Tax=Acidisoma sp. L85 TaxID=1641850 RepID=UPI00131D6ADD|nr:hypothetical protein [Acidisoma sp. L85]
MTVRIRSDVAPKRSPVQISGGERCKGGIDAPISEKAVIRETDDQRIRLHPVLKVGSKKGVYRILLAPVPEVIGKQCQGDRR